MSSKTAAVQVTPYSSPKPSIPHTPPRLQETHRLMAVHLNPDGGGNVRCSSVKVCALLSTATFIMSTIMVITCAVDPNCYSSSLSHDNRQYCNETTCTGGWIVTAVVSGIFQYLSCGILWCK